MTVTPPQLSIAITLPIFGAGIAVAHETEILAGHVRVGTVLSNTVITWAQVAEFPQASVDVYVRVSVKLLGQVMLVVTSAKVTTGVPPQLSDVMTLAGLPGGTALAHCTVTFAGQVIAGGVLSSTIMVWAHVDVLPHASVANHVLVIARS